MASGDRTRDDGAVSRGDAELFRKAEALFHDASEVAPDRRRAWLEAATDDEALRSLVAELLAHHRADEDLPGLAEPDAPNRTESTALPTRVGPYELRRELGHGGMGIVYEAERVELGLRVALKLASTRRPSRAQVARFEREQRVLARLQHRHIAQLHDAGITDDGVPYFAMEIIDGDDITAYASAHALSTGRRLALFLDVCDAVQFAHRSLVVHRDIKPSNVLVNERGEVKLLDFGVAKLLEDADSPTLTRTEARVFTPGYAAPEQLRGEAVTTATDVYQLGALLYELVTETPAFDVRELSAHAAEKHVLATDPVAPSKRVGAAGGRGAQISRDLDSIAAKALEKEPERRYASVDALAGDVRRHLDGMPVHARAGTTPYRVRRFIRRNKVPVATVSAFVALLVASVVTLAVQQRETLAQRDLARAAAERAEREAATAAQVTDFLIGLFEGSDPSVARGDTLTARELLARGGDRLEVLSAQPGVQAALLGTVGRIHLNLGELDEAETMLRRALQAWHAIPEPEQGRRVDAELALAATLDQLGRSDQSVSIYRALASDSTVAASADLSARTLYGLFTALHALGERAAADSALAAWGDAVERSVRPDPSSTRSMIRLGQTLAYGGDTDGAELLLRRAVDATRSLYGDRHPNLMTALLALQVVFQGREPTPGEDSVTAEAVSLGRVLHPEGHPELALALERRAAFFRRSDRLAEAESAQREALSLETPSPDRDGIGYVTRARGLATILASRGELTEAEEILRSVRAWWQRNYGAEYLYTMLAERDLAVVLVRRGQFVEPEEILTRLHERWAAVRGPDDEATRGAAGALVELYEASGRPELAARYRARPGSG